MSEYYNPYEEPQRPAPEPRSGEQEPEEPRRRQQRRRPKAKPESKPGPLVEFLTDARVRMFAGIMVLLLAAYCLIAAVSAIFNSGADQAVLQYNSLGQIVSSGRTVANDAGPAGALIGRIMLTDTLGLGSLVIIFYMLAIGVRLVGLSKVRLLPLTLKCLVLAIAVSIVAGLLTFNFAGPLRYGGDHGYYVNRWLIDMTSPFGAIGVSLAMITLVILIFLKQLSAAYDSWSNYMAERRAKAERRKLADLSHLDEADGQPESAGNNARREPDGQPSAFEPEADEANDDPIDPNDLFNLNESDEPDEPAPRAEAADRQPEDTSFEVIANEIEEADHVTTDAYDPTADLSRFHLPPLDLLIDRTDSKVTVDTEEQESNKQRIIDALAQFNIQIESIKATVGPTITLFEVVPAPGQRIAAIKRVEEDLALALKALGIRIIAPIPGRGTIGIEVPNSDPQVVSMRSIIGSKRFQECKFELPMALGATISNEVFIADLAKMPHLLVAGATGQGKSVGLNAIITSLLYKKHPAELKFVLIDPKMVEFSLYRTLEKHYLAKLPDEEDPVITDPAKVVATLNSLCVEMDNRYSLLSAAGCRGLKEYNQKFIDRRLNPEKGHKFMPYIVVIVDEFADLIMTAGKEVEAPICRLAQKARAIGIHVIIATQRPSTNVITGLIKANFPGRIAFRVAQMVDSKTILDRSGAHQLVGKGDMFFSTNGNLERVQCAFIDTPEVESICEFISDQQGYPMAYELPEYVPEVMGDGSGVAYTGGGGGMHDRDPLFEEAARFLVSAGNTASTSSLQRRYSIGYNRAGKLMDQLEAAGIVSPAVGSKPRNILVDPMTLDSILG